MVSGCGYPAELFGCTYCTMDPPDCFSAGVLYAVVLIAIQVRLTDS